MEAHKFDSDFEAWEKGATIPDNWREALEAAFCAGRAVQQMRDWLSENQSRAAWRAAIRAGEIRYKRETYYEAAGEDATPPQEGGLREPLC